MAVAHRRQVEGRRFVRGARGLADSAFVIPQHGNSPSSLGGPPAQEMAVVGQSPHHGRAAPNPQSAVLRERAQRLLEA